MAFNPNYYGSQYPMTQTPGFNAGWTAHQPQSYYPAPPGYIQTTAPPLNYYAPQSVSIPPVQHVTYCNHVVQPPVVPQHFTPHQNIHLVPVRPIHPPGGVRTTLGHMGVLGKHEKKRLHNMRKYQEKLEKKQWKAANHMYY